MGELLTWLPPVSIVDLRIAFSLPLFGDLRAFFNHAPRMPDAQVIQASPAMVRRVNQEPSDVESIGA